MRSAFLREDLETMESLKALSNKEKTFKGQCDNLLKTLQRFSMVHKMYWLWCFYPPPLSLVLVFIMMRAQRLA